MYQLCLGIIASGIGFVLAQRILFRFRDIRRRLWILSANVFCTESVATGTGIWVPAERIQKCLTMDNIAPFIFTILTISQFINYYYTFLFK